MHYKLEKLFTRKREPKYFEWLEEYEASLRKLLHYNPTSIQLQNLVAAALLQEDGFLGHVLAMGITDFNDQRAKVDELAKAGAGILVTRHRDDPTPTA